MLEKLRTFFNKPNNLELVNSALRGEINTLQEWLEETQKERDFYKNLLLEKTGVVVPVAEAQVLEDTPKPVGKKNWNVVRHNLEMEALKKSWETNRRNREGKTDGRK